MIVFEAADVFVAVVDAAILWAKVLAAALGFVLCMVAFCVGPLIAPAARAVRKRATGPSWARGHARARFLARTLRRRSRGRSEAHDYREAA